jgi:iron complex transport system permease protein
MTATQAPPSDAVTEPPSQAGPTRVRGAILLPVLVVLLIVALVINLGAGAVSISPEQLLGIVFGWGDASFTVQQVSVLEAIRAPRVVLTCLVGAALAVSGAALQGVFRNPLADPGLIGVANGAAVGAVGAIVLGLATFGGATTPVAAFAGGLVAAITVYACARHNGRTEVVTLVLTGVAINAIAAAIVGLLTFYANDTQLRTIVFWTLGSMGGSTWSMVLATGPLLAITIVLLPLFGRRLDMLVLGEREAHHLGVHTERLRIGVVGLATLGTGAAVATGGVIVFVGLVIPHLLRIIAGPGHRLLLPASALGGAILMLFADLAARTVAVPAELPVGVLTALIGGPFFLVLLLHTRNRHGGWG